MIKIVIAGAAGRMGGALIRCSQRIKDIQVVGAIDSENHADLGKDAGVLSGINELGVPLDFDLQDALSDADVLIDFTFHTSVPGNIAISAGLGLPAIIGTTGLNNDETIVVHQAAEKIPVVWAPNMSLGMNLLFATVKKAASTLSSEYAVEIDETHHIHKKDAPSGTALRLGEKVAEGLGGDLKPLMIHDPEGVDNVHAQDKIVIRSYRKGEALGDHVVSFENEGEKIEFTHHAKSRDAFALGAFHAAKWIVDKNPGLYDMQDVLGL
ncbi:4-hydroxy-tetrahydrodipicolinate reductase [Verrucomicrobiota bacterium]